MSWLDQVCASSQPSSFQGLTAPQKQGQSTSEPLAERVAKVLDRESSFATVDTLYLVQRATTIRLGGIAPNAALVKRLVKIASQVEGVSRVDTSRVIVENGKVYSDCL